MDLLEFCPIESVKTIFAKSWQILANLGSLKCDPSVKHLFLWLFIELQHKLCKKYLNIRDKMLKVHNSYVLWSLCQVSYFRKQIVP